MTSEEKKYHIDRQPADFRDIIRKAKEYGYDSNDGISLTSEAARILRANGHSVGNISDIEDALGFIFGDVKSDLSKIKVKP